MTVENFENSLRCYQENVPFNKFTVVMTSGKQFEIDQPGAMTFRRGIAVFISSSGVPIIFDHENVVQFIAAPNDTTAA